MIDVYVLLRKLNVYNYHIVCGIPSTFITPMHATTVQYHQVPFLLYSKVFVLV